jgi:hypothetical protein
MLYSANMVLGITRNPEMIRIYGMVYIGAMQILHNLM